MTLFRTLEPRLHVADLARSLAFYRDVLGFTVETTFPEHAPTFAILIRDQVALQLGGPAGRKDLAVPSSCTMYFDATDVRALHELLRGSVKIEWGPDVYFYRRREFAVRDPDGHLLIFSEPTDDPPTARD